MKNLNSPDCNGNKKIPIVLGFFYCNGKLENGLQECVNHCFASSLRSGRF